MAVPKTWTMSVCKLLLILLTVDNIKGYDNDELELFDIVEQVNQNFYELLGIQQTAKISEVKRAYRKLSLLLHPDKNKKDNAEETFRNLVAVYEVLKDEKKRRMYDEVLVTGLPDWRMPIYYYRKMRKIGLVEMMVILLLIITVGQFLVAWATYYEKQYELEEVLSSRLKKEKKGRKAQKQQAAQLEEVEKYIEEELRAIPKPHWKDLLPFRLIMVVVFMVMSLPRLPSLVKEKIVSLRSKNEQEQDEASEESCIPQRKPRPRDEFPEFTPELCEETAPVLYMDIGSSPAYEQTPENTLNNEGKEWTERELSLLSKATVKYPPGTSQRWQKVAVIVGRSVQEVTIKSKGAKFITNINPSMQGLSGATFREAVSKDGRLITNDISTRDEVDLVQSQDNILRKRKTDTTGEHTKSPNTQNTVPTQSRDIHLCTNIDTSNDKLAANNDKPKSLAENVSKSDDDSWSQNQQKIFEWSLAQYSKGTPERWEKIAEHIPGKTKEDCVQRFKYLADIVKKKRSK